MSIHIAERARWWADRMVRRPSVTGSADEATFAPFLLALLHDSTLFRDRPDDAWMIDVPGGAHPRRCVLALLRGEGCETVVLTGHFDTVATGNFGPLQPLACDPEALLPALLRSLDDVPGAQAALARSDLASGAFVPGRGLLDMKGGLAAALAEMERSAADPARRGNLLFVAVPDEEANSAGAHAAATALPGIAAARGLTLTAAINLDAIADNGDGSDGRAVALGTVGKLCVSALVIGRPVHACYGFDGIGAAALAGALAAELEWEPALTERSANGEQGAGPTLLGMKDDRDSYDVTMPGSVWLYWNVITHARDPDAVLEAAAEAAARCGTRLFEVLAQRRAAGTGQPFSALPAIRVVRYAALLEALLAAKPHCAALIDARAAGLAAEGLDLPEQCRRLTLFVAELAELDGPAIVLGFASVPYLPARLSAPALERAIRTETEAVAARHGTAIRIVERFPAICDISAFGQGDQAALTLVGAETPTWGHGVVGLAAAGIPSINAGPWGRDYHGRLERMHRNYAETVLPDLIGGLARAIIETAAAEAGE